MQGTERHDPTGHSASVIDHPSSILRTTDCTYRMNNNIENKSNSQGGSQDDMSEERRVRAKLAASAAERLVVSVLM